MYWIDEYNDILSTLLVMSIHIRIIILMETDNLKEISLVIDVLTRLLPIAEHLDSLPEYCTCYICHTSFLAMDGCSCWKCNKNWCIECATEEIDHVHGTCKKL